MTETLTSAATDRLPALCFDFAANHYSMAGESYPEDTSAFYGPWIERLQKHVDGLNGAQLTFDFALKYFNSSSAKVIMTLFDMLDEAATRNQVTVHWIHESDDDNMAELGTEFGEDLVHARFELVARD